MAGYGTWGAPTFPKPKPKKKKSGHWYDGITGFIGHLGGDVRDAVVGIPMGVVSLMKDPIKSGKAIGQASWHDWSPLFHGDVREWAKNFYEHPLAPILDVVGVATLGLGFAAKGASALSKAGAVSKGGRVASFGNPGRAALHRSYQRELVAMTGGKMGVKNPQVQTIARRRAFKDPEYLKAKNRVGKTPEGVPVFKAYSNNPLIRGRQKAVAALGEKAAQSQRGKRLGVDKMMGDAAWAKRWKKMDISTRQTGAAVMQQRQLAAIHKLGKHLTGLSKRDLFDQVEGTMRKGLIAQAHRVHIDDLDMKAMKNEGYVLVRDESLLDRKHTNKFLDKNTDKGLVEGLRVWGKDQTTNQLKNAQRAADDKNMVLVVSGRASSKMAREAGNASRAAMMFYKHPTTVWKWMVLAASPRYFVNNVVGNSLMLAMSANPIIMGRAMTNHFRTVHGAKKAEGAMSEIEKANAQVMGRGFYYKWLAGESQGWGGAELREFKTAPEGYNPSSKKARIKRGAKEGLFPITHKMSDTTHRGVAANYAMLRTPEYQMAYGQLRKRGMNHMEAHRRAADEAIHQPNVRSYLREEVNHVLGQYHQFTKFERNVKNVVPFYAWDRAITRHTAHMVMNRPYQAAIVAAIGERGTQETERILGNIPDFLKGAIPVDGMGVLEMIAGKSPGGRKGLLMTQGINPYATIGDITESAMSASGLTGDQRLRMGESLGGQLNPILGGLIESVSGASMVSGAPIQPKAGGLLGGIYLRGLENVPAVKLGETIARKYGALGGYEKSKDPKHPFLFSKDARTELSAFVGAPVKQANTKKMAEHYRRQNKILKGRKKTIPAPYGSNNDWGFSREFTPAY